MDRQELLKQAKPILFNTEMVKAILEGRKTVTRRVVKFTEGRNPNWTGYIKDGLTLYNGTNEPCNKKPSYAAGDYLYVRETWSIEKNVYWYKAGFVPKTLESMKWKPSIHMPKEAARIFLRVKDVRAERLQDITNEQILKEGCKQSTIKSLIKQIPDDKDTDLWIRSVHVFEFSQLWDSTTKEKDQKLYGWDANPWVWVIEFERI